MSVTDCFPASTDIGILSFDGVTLLDVSGPAEVFARAGGYRIHLLSPAGGTVTTSAGVSLTETLPIAEAGGLDTVLIAGANDTDYVSRLRPYLPEISRLVESARRVASVCTGAFVLAELGLLDGRVATTHWRETAQLGQRFPEVTVEPDAIFIRDGKYVSSAGISTGIDMSLSLVEEDRGLDVAAEVARDMVITPRHGAERQAPDRPKVPTINHDPLRRAISQVVDDPRGRHTVTSMATAAQVSQRHLSRLVKESTGLTPARWIERVRLDVACRVLLVGESVTEAAFVSGLGSDENLRRAFRRHLGTTPSAYRERYRARPA